MCRFDDASPLRVAALVAATLVASTVFQASLTTGTWVDYLLVSAPCATSYAYLETRHAWCRTSVPGVFVRTLFWPSTIAVRFSVGEARVAGEATREAQRASRAYDAVVALGARPWRALGVGELPEFSYTYQPDDGCYYARLPHPSGLCRSWNQTGAFERARDAMRAVYPGIPWGELLDGGEDDDE